MVQVDGMGTANRSKAFHDVCWKNLKDAGFPDRVLWIKAAAEKYPQLDAARVGIYGGSAGGQNAMAAAKRLILDLSWPERREELSPIPMITFRGCSPSFASLLRDRRG